MVPLLVYSALRLGLLAVALVALWIAGARGWLWGLLAVLVAWGLSYVLLAGPRDAAALWVAGRVERRRAGGPRFSAGVEADAAAEDVEAAAGSQEAAADPARAAGSQVDAQADVRPEGQIESPRPSSTP